MVEGRRYACSSWTLIGSPAARAACVARLPYSANGSNAAMERRESRIASGRIRRRSSEACFDQTRNKKEGSSNPLQARLSFEIWPSVMPPMCRLPSPAHLLAARGHSSPMSESQLIDRPPVRVLFLTCGGADIRPRRGCQSEPGLAPHQIKTFAADQINRRDARSGSVADQ